MGTARWDVQDLVFLASEITCSLCRAPSIPVSNWGERVASSLRPASERGPVLAGISVHGPDGSARALESAGAGWPGARERFLTARLLDPRRGGWGHHGDLHGAAQSQTILVSSLPEKALEDWRSLGAVEVIRCSVPIAESRPERRVTVIVGASEAERENTLARSLLLTSLLPIIAERAALAFGWSRPIGSSERLTPREEVVLELLMQGQSIKQIAGTLDRSPHTVHDHVKSLHTKLGARNRGELVARGLGHVGGECAAADRGPARERPETRVMPASASMRLPRVVERAHVSLKNSRG